MIYHPGHFHGISHEADTQWLLSLPIAEQELIGDGKTTRWRLKYEARKWASFRTSGIDLSLMARMIGSEETQRIATRLMSEAINRTIEIDDDSHYINIRPPLDDGRWYSLEYHHVMPLPSGKEELL